MKTRSLVLTVCRRSDNSLLRTLRVSLRCGTLRTIRAFRPFKCTAYLKFTACELYLSIAESLLGRERSKCGSTQSLTCPSILTTTQSQWQSLVKNGLRFTSLASNRLRSGMQEAASQSVFLRMFFHKLKQLMMESKSRERIRRKSQLWSLTSIIVSSSLEILLVR